jgi:hypothetical protein
MSEFGAALAAFAKGSSGGEVNSIIRIAIMI